MKYCIVVGGGISEIWEIIDRKLPVSAIRAWFIGTRKRPLDVGIECDLSDDSYDPDMVRYREFWHWVWNNNDAVREIEGKEAARKDYPYTYGHISRSAIEKAEKVRGMTDAELKHEYEWSGYGPFTRG